MSATDVRPVIVYEAAIIIGQVHAASFNKLVPPVVPYVDSDCIPVELPLQIVNFGTGLRLAYSHREILAA